MLCSELARSPATSNAAVVEVQLAVTELYKVFDSVRRRQAEARLVEVLTESVARKRQLVEQLKRATENAAVSAGNS
jgi:predicted protein tyrosine phosphatase